MSHVAASMGGELRRKQLAIRVLMVPKAHASG